MNRVYAEGVQEERWGRSIQETHDWIIAQEERHQGGLWRMMEPYGGWENFWEEVS